MKMEKEMKIKNGKYNIYGVLNTSNNKNDLIIFIHGLGGHANEHQFYNAARYFTKKGFNTFRISLYPGKKDSRTLIDSTIATHARDLEKVVDHFSKKFKSIYVVGHSIGGLTILKSRLDNVRRAVLWDPSLKLRKFTDEMATYDKRLDMYIMHWGTDILVPKAMVEEWSSTDTTFLKRFVIPVKIIFASKGILKKIWGDELKNIKVQKSIATIDGASHCFDEEDTEDRLFKETLKWIKRV
jgi:dienelactone hydrolase